MTDLFIQLFLDPTLPSGELNGVAIFTYMGISAILGAYIIER